MSAHTLSLPVPIGSELGGGIYVGPHFEGGEVHHLIAAHETLSGSHWNDAEHAANTYRDGIFTGWRLPTKNEMMSALMHAQEHFKRALHWTASPRDGRSFWVVDFERGDVLYGDRQGGFRARPFRTHQFAPSHAPAQSVDANAIFGTSADLNLAASLVRSVVTTHASNASALKKIDWFAMLEHAADILERRRDDMESFEDSSRGASNG